MIILSSARKVARNLLKSKQNPRSHLSLLPHPRPHPRPPQTQSTPLPKSTQIKKTENHTPPNDLKSSIRLLHDQQQSFPDAPLPSLQALTPAEHRRVPPNLGLSGIPGRGQAIVGTAGGGDIILRGVVRGWVLGVGRRKGGDKRDR